MNQNMQEAPELPPRLPINVYGESLARWHYKGFYYGPDRQAIPAEIAAMGDQQQAEIALKNWRSQQEQRDAEMTEAKEAEEAQELQAKEEAERREEQDKEDEIERRAQARVKEIMDGNPDPAPTVATDKNPSTDTVPGPDDEAGSEQTEPLTKKQELAAILAECKTKAELEAQLRDVHYLHIKRAVEGFEKTPGNKAKNIAILAECLELT